MGSCCLSCAAQLLSNLHAYCRAELGEVHAVATPALDQGRMRPACGVVPMQCSSPCTGRLLCERNSLLVGGVKGALAIGRLCLAVGGPDHLALPDVVRAHLPLRVGRRYGHEVWQPATAAVCAVPSVFRALCSRFARFLTTWFGAGHVSLRSSFSAMATAAKTGPLATCRPDATLDEAREWV
jgi:hypothetical protein